MSTVLTFNITYYILFIMYRQCMNGA